MVGVISTNFFVGVSVAFYAAVASAIPTPDGSSNITALDPRAPAQHGCGQSRMQWRSRECAPERGPQQWDDVCENDIRVPGICPPDTYCNNVLDVDPDNILINSIQCLPGAEPGTARPRKTRTDPEVGSSSIKQVTTQLGPSHVYQQFVIVRDDILASVSAFFLSEDKAQVVKPVERIVGKLRGKDIEVCAGDPASAQRALECYPTGRQQLGVGDIIDFSWGLSSGQSGSLKYVVYPTT